MTDMIWQDPPPLRRGRNLDFPPAPKGAMRDWVKGLAERPGVWSRYPWPHRTANVTNYGKRYPHIEFTERRVADNWIYLYGRTRA